jgi:hypothetical protein
MPIAIIWTGPVLCAQSQTTCHLLIFAMWSLSYCLVNAEHCDSQEIYQARLGGGILLSAENLHVILRVRLLLTLQIAEELLHQQHF